jgi:hypothetical protein
VLHLDSLLRCDVVTVQSSFPLHLTTRPVTLCKMFPFVVMLSVLLVRSVSSASGKFPIGPLIRSFANATHIQFSFPLGPEPPTWLQIRLLAVTLCNRRLFSAIVTLQCIAKKGPSCLSSRSHNHNQQRPPSLTQSQKHR